MGITDHRQSAKPYDILMDEQLRHIGEVLRERNIELETLDPVIQGGFTQIPNFILRNPELSIGPKVTYAMFLSYAWHHDFCFPGQERLAQDMGMSASRVNDFVKALECADLIEIIRRGQGKTNFYKIKFTVKNLDFGRPKTRLRPNQITV